MDRYDRMNETFNENSRYATSSSGELKALNELPINDRLLKRKRDILNKIYNNWRSICTDLRSTENNGKYGMGSVSRFLLFHSLHRPFERELSTNHFFYFLPQKLAS